MRKEIKKSRGNPKYINKLGILYARYGLYDKAEKEFMKVLINNSRYVPSLINLGNIYYLKKQIETAITYYNKAYKIAPNNPRVLLCIARANHELENYDKAGRAYRKLKSINPGLAQQFTYLEMKAGETTTARASNIAEKKEVVLWEE